MPAPMLRLGDELALDLGAFAQSGWRAGIWASSGRGKSWLVGVIVEELLDSGVPVVLIDPEGEHWTLRERYRTVVAGGPHGDLPLCHVRGPVREILRVALSQGLAVVFDLAELPTNAQQQEAARPVLEELFSLLGRERRTAGVVIEEAQTFAPQFGPAPTAEIMAALAKRGRKRGVLLVAASQRTQAVSKEFLSQVNFPMLGGFDEQLDFDAVRHHAAGKTFRDLNSLPVGVFWFPRLGQFHHIRARRVTHGGGTPDLGGEVALRGAVVDEGLEAAIAHLAQAIRRAEAEERSQRGEIAELRRRVEELQALLAAKDQEIERLQVALKVAAAQAAARGQAQLDRAGTVSVRADRVEIKGRVAGSQGPAGGDSGRAASVPASGAPAPGLGGHQEEWLEHPVVVGLLRRAQALTRRRLGGFEGYCSFALAALARAPGGLSVKDMALALGLGSQQSAYRIRVACRQLAEVGLAREGEDGRFALHAENIQTAMALADAKAAGVRRQKR